MDGEKGLPGARYIAPECKNFVNCGLHSSANGKGKVDGNLGQDLLGYLPMNVGETKFPPRIGVSEFLVVQTEQMKNRGVQVVKMHAVLDRLDSMLVRGTMAHPALYASSSHPKSETG